MSFLLGLAFAAACATSAEATKYPPGPGGICTDTLTLFQIENTGDACHPSAPDTVNGVRGIIVAFDTKPSAFAFYIQNTFADGPHGWTGVQVFTGAFNYTASVPSSPSGGNLALGDSVVVYGSIIEFNNETEIQGPDGSQSTDDIIIRKIASGVTLPPVKVGTTATYNWNPAISAATAEPWEGCLVRVNSPLRVARTATGLGVGPNTFLVVDPNTPSDSLLVDGTTLTTLVAPSVGTDLDFVQGIMSQKTITGVNSYRIMVRGPNDFSVLAPPNLIDAYPVANARLRLTFDKSLDLTTAENEANYSLDSFFTIDMATLVGGAGAVVELDLGGSSAGVLDVVHASGIGSAACPACVSSSQGLGFVNGILSVAQIQAPDVAHLPPTCEDRSKFAGPGTSLGPRLTVRGVGVQSYGSLYYITDAGGGPRAGISVFAPIAPLTVGHQYRVTGNVQEFQGETEISFVGDVVDEGAASVPPPSDQSFAAMSDTTCDQTQSTTNSEDYEGGLIRFSNVRIVPFNTAPTNPAPGASFRIVTNNPPSDTILVSNQGNHYVFDPEPGMVLGIAAILHVTPGVRLLPRADTDIMLLSQVQPASGGNQGSISATISGFGFQAGTTARLRRSGQSDIVGTSPVASADTRNLTTTFDLTGALAGVWDVIVNFPATYADTMPAAFTIESTEAPQLRISLLGPPIIRSNTRTAFDLVIENSGNVDARDVPVWVTGIPTAATAALDLTLGYPPQSGGEPSWSQVPLTLQKPGYQYLPLVIPRAAPGTTTRRVLLTVSDSVSAFELHAALTPPWNSGTVFKTCLVDGGVIANAACMGSQIDAIAAYLDANPQIPALSGVAEWAKIAWQCEGAGTLQAAVTEAQQALDFMLQPIVQQGSPPASCATALPPQWMDTLGVTVVTSIDPNDKLGPHGPLSLQQAIPYSIRFENLAAATAPAQTVVVSDPIPIATLDPSTISLGPITFGSSTVIPPPGLSSFATRYSMPSRNVLLDISVGVDPISHTLSWAFTSLDPASGQPVTNPLVGFLPPNHTSPEGEGSVLFTIRPQSSIGNGATISNYASIRFDNNNPIVTPTCTNMIDIAPPSSHVNPLSAHSDQPSVPVAWTAENSPNDLRDFTLYVSEDGQPYRVWRLNTAVTADTLVPAADHHPHSYSFFSVARDIAGNVEATPVAADATTQSRTAVDGAAGLVLSLDGASPNPARGTIGVTFSLPSKAKATLDVIDVAGRRVMRREVGGLGPGTHHLALAANPPLRPGLYFLRLAQGTQALGTRVAVIR